MKIALYFTLFIFPVLSFGSDFKTYTVSGNSMSPAIMSGNKVVVNTKQPIMRGDLVAVSFKHSKTPLIKRVAALANDRVEFMDNALFINGTKLRDFDQERWSSTVNQLRHYDWTIPPEHCFILGDNPVNSRDSRRLGIISYDQIQGKVIDIFKK